MRERRSKLRRNGITSVGVAGLVLAATWATVPASNAQPGTLGAQVGTVDLKDLVGDSPVTRRTSASRAGNLRIRVAGKATTAGTLMPKAFAPQRALASRLAAQPQGFFGPTTTVEEVIETAQGTHFVSQISTVVADPAVAQAAGLPRFRPRSGFEEMTGESKRVFDRLKASLASKPTSHPLRLAAAQGDRALFDAVSSGVGEVSVTRVGFVPAENLRLSGRTVQTPTLKGGQFDWSTRTTRDLKFVPSGPTKPGSAVTGAPKGDGESPVTQSPAPVTAERSGGSSTETLQFLTGWTIDDGFREVYRFDLGIVGHVNVIPEAWYAVGLRAPVQLDATLSPTESIETCTLRLVTKCRNRNNTLVLLSGATALNADAGFYTSTGLPASQVYEGKELVLEAGAQVTIKGEVIGISFNESFGKDFDFGFNFKPPFAKDCTNCGLEGWIPSNVTRTGFDFLGIVSGGAEIGFKVAGTGSLDVDFAHMSKGVAGPSQRVTLNDAAQVPMNGDIGHALNEFDYGYRVSNPTYAWNVTVTPGVRGSALINANPFGQIDLAIDPIWLTFAEIELGTLRLGAHEGTASRLTRQPGRYIPFDSLRSGPGGNATDPKIADVITGPAAGSPVASDTSVSTTVPKIATRVSTVPKAKPATQSTRVVKSGTPGNKTKTVPTRKK